MSTISTSKHSGAKVIGVRGPTLNVGVGIDVVAVVFTGLAVPIIYE